MPGCCLGVALAANYTERSGSPGVPQRLVKEDAAQSFVTRPSSARQSWTVDICAMAGGTKLAIEYDGAHWHRATAKRLVDERKSTNFLAAGYAVVRLREDDLPQFPIQHPRYKEIRVYSAPPHPRAVLKETYAWLDDALTMGGSSNGA